MEEHRCPLLDSNSCKIELFVEKLAESRVLGDALHGFVESWLTAATKVERAAAKLQVEGSDVSSASESDRNSTMAGGERLKRIQSMLLDGDLAQSRKRSTKERERPPEDALVDHVAAEAVIALFASKADGAELRAAELETQLPQHYGLVALDEPKTVPLGENEQLRRVSSNEDLTPRAPSKQLAATRLFSHQCRHFLNMHLDLIQQGANGHWMLQSLREEDPYDESRDKERLQLEHRFRDWMNGFVDARDKLIQIWKMRKDVVGMMAPDRENYYPLTEKNRDFSQIDWNWFRLPNSWSVDREMKRWNVVCGLVEQTVWEKFRVWPRRGTRSPHRYNSTAFRPRRAKAAKQASTMGPPKVIHIAEIGVFVGETSLYLLSRCFLRLYQESNVLVQYHLIDPWQSNTFGGWNPWEVKSWLLDFYRATRGDTAKMTGSDVYRTLMRRVGNATTLYGDRRYGDAPAAPEALGRPPTGRTRGGSDATLRSASVADGTGGGGTAASFASALAGNKEMSSATPCLRKKIHSRKSPLAVYEVQYHDLHGRSALCGVSEIKIPENLPGVFFHRVLSHRAIERISVLDLLYIDGDHSFAAVHADLRNFVPITRHVVAGHDFDYYKFPGVSMAVMNAKVPTTDAFRHFGFRFQQDLYLDSDNTWWSRLTSMPE
ncbi:unnamed protein product [Amoebophrya sp. A120]|nr:unnamed protein product [Amoebophrya sp. A120]|eukprot:GSA120T00011523001.1